jgi:hypothetical protein
MTTYECSGLHETLHYEHSRLVSSVLVTAPALRGNTDDKVDGGLSDGSSSA